MGHPGFDDYFYRNKAKMADGQFDSCVHLAVMLMQWMQGAMTYYRAGGMELFPGQKLMHYRIGMLKYKKLHWEHRWALCQGQSKPDTEMVTDILDFVGIDSYEPNLSEFKCYAVAIGVIHDGDIGHIPKLVRMKQE